MEIHSESERAYGNSTTVSKAGSKPQHPLPRQQQCVHRCLRVIFLRAAGQGVLVPGGGLFLRVESETEKMSNQFLKKYSCGKKKTN